METIPVEAVNSPLTASGISTAVYASMTSCASKKSYKGSQLKSLKAFYEPARMSDFKQGQTNLALLCAVIAGGIPFNFVETYHFCKFMKILKPSFKIPS